MRFAALLMHINGALPGFIRGTKAANKGNEVFSSTWDRYSGGIKAPATYSMRADTGQYI